MDVRAADGDERLFVAVDVDGERVPERPRGCERQPPDREVARADVLDVAGELLVKRKPRRMGGEVLRREMS